MSTKKINMLNEGEANPKKSTWPIMDMDLDPQTQQVIEDENTQPDVEETISSEDTRSPTSSPIIGQDKSPSMRNRLLPVNPTLNILDDEEEEIEPLTQIEIEELLTQEDSSTFSLPPPAVATTSTTSVSTSKLIADCTSTCTPIAPSSSKLRLKPNGLAQQAIKAIRDQKTLDDIWRHSTHASDANSDKLSLLVTGEISEFNRRILVCASAPTGSPCLLLVSTEVENVIKGQRVCLYPPFARKFIDYRGSFVSFYFGAERILCEQEDERVDEEIEGWGIASGM